MLQALDVLEKQVRALVRGGAPRKADGQRGFVEQHAGAPLYFLDEGGFREAVRLLDFLERNSDGVTHVCVVAAPFGDFTVEQILKRRRGPRGRMYSIRNRMDRKLWKHVLGHFAVAHGDPVYVAREVQGEVGHVQEALGAEAHLLKQDRPRLTQNLFDELPGKSIVTRLDAGVRRK